jgi:hypothetical protein
MTCMTEPEAKYDVVIVNEQEELLSFKQPTHIVSYKELVRVPLSCHFTLQLHTRQ